MIVDVISDLHGFQPKLEGGDLLLLCGDYTGRGTSNEWKQFAEWLKEQKYKHKIFIAGNHDKKMLTHRYGNALAKEVGGVYLEDEEYIVDGLKIWGSPWNVRFVGQNPEATAFSTMEEIIADKMALIPNDIDILLTHSPPYDILDGCSRGRFGSKAIHRRLQKGFSKLKLHCFGHIHEGFGDCIHPEFPGVDFVNASQMNSSYINSNYPIRINLS